MQALAARPQFAGELSNRQKIERLYRTVYGRSPDADELAMAEQFLSGPAPAAIGPAWQYGYGEVDEATRRLREFRPLARWTGRAWQFGEKFPDPKVGHLILNPNGGHPGSNLAFSPVRRWTSPVDATIGISGNLATGNPNGDGVRGRVVSNRSGELGQWIAHNQSVATAVGDYQVRKGEILDFIVDCRQSSFHDSFTWAPTIRVQQAPADAVLAETEWNSEAEFAGPTPPMQPPSRWEQLCSAAAEQ